MASINVEAYVGYIDVDVDLSDFETEDLIEELQRRKDASSMSLYAQGILNDIYHLRRDGQDYQRELDNLIYEQLGRMEYESLVLFALVCSGYASCF